MAGNRVLTNRTIIDLRIGSAHANAGLSLRRAYDGTGMRDPRIESLLAALFAVPYRLQ